MGLRFTGSTEVIVNGGFEDSPDFTGWINSAYTTISTSEKHSGAKSARISYENYGNTLSQNLPSIIIANISSFTGWFKRSASVNNSHMFAFTTELGLPYNVDLKDYIPVDGAWHEVDLLQVMEDYFTSHGLSPTTLSRIGFSNSQWGYVSYFYVDDVSLTISPTSYNNIISLEEDQICKPAIRNIPLRTTGSHIDLGTYKLKPREMKFSVRLTDDELTTFLGFFTTRTLLTLYLDDDDGGVWTYTGWFTKYPQIYEMFKISSTDIKEWKCDLEFKIETISYSGDAYSESTSTIMIDEVNYHPVLDAYFSETTKLCDEEDYINQAVDLQTTVWDRSEFEINYVIRTSNAGKWLLDQLLIAHTSINLNDTIRGIIDTSTGGCPPVTIYNPNVFITKINEVWEGDINSAKPWRITIKMVLLDE